MWKLTSIFKRLSERQQICEVGALFFGKRSFLSDTYRCEEAWEKRLQTPMFQKVNVDDLYQAVDRSFSRNGKASVVDVDVFVNAVRDASYVDELEDIIHKLRLSDNTLHTLASTHHAVIRFLLQTEQYDSLFRILNDRLNYGIFPDNYCLCLLLDTLIQKNKITEAARVSTIHMLQEDWSNQLVKTLALYACHLYVQNPVPWEDEVVEDDSGEEIKVRVKYIRNPYFDDHFDLRDPNLLVGKTLAAIGATINDAVGITYHLVGLGIYNKWEKAILFLERLLKSGVKEGVFFSGLKLFEETFEKQLNDENDPESKFRDQLRTLIKDLDSKGLMNSNDLHAAIVLKLNQAIANEEQVLIKNQLNLYNEWQVNRENLLKEELKEAQRQERIAMIKQEKEKLILKEQELFFFDNEDKIDLLLEQEELKQKESRQETKLSKAQKDAIEENYIPPDIRK